MRFAVVTLFPELIRDALAHGVVGRALAGGVLGVETFDPRSYTTDVHRSVDDRPYGGGPGMVLKAQPVREALAAARAALPAGSRRVFLSAAGRRFDQVLAREAVQWPGLILLAGRYEGVDERVIQADIDEEWSIGDYVLSGGELPALVVIDALARLLPGTLGCAESAQAESFSDGLLDWPHYTRPAEWSGVPVPAVLAGGDHAAIARWRLREALGRTWLRRPELIERRVLSDLEKVLLDEFKAEVYQHEQDHSGS